MLVACSYLAQIWYDSCFKQLKHLSLVFKDSQTEDVDLDTQLEKCEIRKAQLKTWIRENQERIEKKKKIFLNVWPKIAN